MARSARNDTLKRALRQFGTLTHIVWPRRSLLSKQPLDGPGLLAAEEWQALTFITDPYCDVCGVPFDHDAGIGTICGHCAASPPRYDRARSALLYDEFSKDLVLGLKRSGRREGLSLYGQWMTGAAGDLLDESDLLIPVPLHYQRLVTRGFNQAAWLASSIARRTGHRMIVDALKRVRPTQSQGHLSADARLRNLSGAIRVNPRHQSRIRGRRVIIVDDVLTSGATVNVCARVLKQAGAAHVGVVTLARVARPVDVPI